MTAVLKRITAILAVLAALALPAGAGQRADQALEAGALAQAYAGKCTALKIDWLHFASMLEAAGIDPETLEKGPQFKQMVHVLRRATLSLEGVPTAEVCRRAVADFGPKGKVAPGLMSDGAGAATQNKVFDWLYRKGF